MQVVFLYTIIRWLWRLFQPPASRRSGAGGKTAVRFDTTGKNVSDADFEEIREKGP